MEHLGEYRHRIDKKTKKIFIKYFKQALSEVDVNKFGFVGILGSVKEKYSHDIDVLIFPSKDAKIGESIKEMAKLYKKVDELLKAHHERYYVVWCPKKVIQEMMYYLSSLEEGGAGLIPVHSLFFTDYVSFKKFNPKSFEKEIKKNMITLYGRFEIIKELKVYPSEKIEPYFFILEYSMCSKIKTFPRHLIRSSTESLLTHLKDKYKLPIKKTKIHNVSEIEPELAKCLKMLDDKLYK